MRGLKRVELGPQRRGDWELGQGDGLGHALAVAVVGGGVEEVQGAVEDGAQRSQRAFLWRLIAKGGELCQVGELGAAHTHWRHHESRRTKNTCLHSWIVRNVTLAASP